jgi:hypothetical protein
MTLTETQRGPADKLLDLVLGSGAHLWHNRPGLNDGGVWRPATNKGRAVRTTAPRLEAGLFVPAAVDLYARLVDIYQLNAELAARFATYAIVETEWRDLKVACAALMLVQKYAGQPVHGESGAVDFLEDDYRSVGQGMMLYYARKSPKMMTPKSVLRVAQLLETPAIAELNRIAGFADAAGRKAPLGRWKQAAARWLRVRESNLPMLEGLVSAGYKETIKSIARKAGYKPETARFFEVLGWKQKQASSGHRTVGLTGLKLQKRERFDGLSEAEICERIADERLSYKDVVGRLPKEIGLTPAIMVATLPSLSDRDLRLLTPTLEELGLLGDAEIRARWEAAVASSTDQRALNVAKNVKSKKVREKLEEAADHAVKKAVAEAIADDTDLHVIFLIDKSGSMEGAIEQSKEALSRILAGFTPEKVHIASFDTMGTVLRPKSPSRAAVQNMLAKIKAAGGTLHGAAVQALHGSGVRIPEGARLCVIVAGDEAGEEGAQLARTFQAFQYRVDAMALILASSQRGSTVRTCAAALRVPFAEVDVKQFEDPYQVPRVLRALLEAPVPAGAALPARPSWVDKVMKTPLLGADGKQQA